MRLIKLFTLSLLLSLSITQLLIASDIKMPLYEGGIYLKEINKREYDSDLYIDNQKILTWRYMDKFYAVYGIPYNSKIGNNRLTIKNEMNKVIKNISMNIKQKNFLTQKIIINKKYTQPDKSILKRIKNDAKQLRQARSIWIDEDPDLYFISPVEGTVSGVFGTRRFYNGIEGNFHNGYDIAASIGTPVIAPSSGKIVLTGHFFYNGKTIVLDHGKGVKSLLIHLDTILVNKDQIIRKGDIIGRVGTTGKSTGPHLHWSVLMNNTYIDPELLINRETIKNLVLEAL